MRRFARRDDNELAIVNALVIVGASVTRLSQAGVPDLLVGYRGRTFLLEVKHASSTGKTKRRNHGADDRGLGPDQQEWWAGWRGVAPTIVRTPEEALKAIGLLDGTQTEVR